MPGTGLAAPDSIDDLYLGRSDELSLGRPLLTGDVLTDVELDAEDHDGTVMIVAHPCSMRGQLGRLLPRIAVAPIRPYQDIPLNRWPDGHFKVLPLPEMRGAEDQHRAVHLLEIASARSAGLDPEKRILSLTGRGIYVLQQRLVYSLTRVEVGLDRLEEQVGHVLLEAELEEEWVDELANCGDAGSRSAESEAFAAFLDGGPRLALLDVTRRTDAVRIVRGEIRRRSAARGDVD